MNLNVIEEKHKKRAEKILDYALSMLPEGLKEEIRRITEKRRDCPTGISEIRVRRKGISTVVISGESIRLSRGITDSEMARLFDRITDGSIYSFENELKEGYITAEYGIRIGIALSEIKNESRLALAAVFRLPLSYCTYTDELFDLWRSGDGSMLLYSPPAAGKTTALSHLSRRISDSGGKRVVIVDERGEFSPEDFSDTTLDIIRGYPKPKGIEIALRTLGAEIIVTDEIGSPEEARLIELSGRSGVPFIASTHAADIGELYSKKFLVPLLDAGFFSSLVRLYRIGSKFGFEAQEPGGSAP